MNRYLFYILMTIPITFLVLLLSFNINFFHSYGTPAVLYLFTCFVVMGIRRVSLGMSFISKKLLFSRAWFTELKRVYIE